MFLNTSFSQFVPPHTHWRLQLQIRGTHLTQTLVLVLVLDPAGFAQYENLDKQEQAHGEARSCHKLANKCVRIQALEVHDSEKIQVYKTQKLADILKGRWDGDLQRRSHKC